jgi:hypothetical protein
MEFNKKKRIQSLRLTSRKERKKGDIPKSRPEDFPRVIGTDFQRITAHPRVTRSVDKRMTARLGCSGDVKEGF